MNSLIRKEGFDFHFNPKKCTDCFGYCCSGESGYVWLNENEINKISEYLDLNKKEFFKYYLRYIKGRYCLKELKIKGNYNCIFFDSENKVCSIYSVRPKQCSDYPFWNCFRNDYKKLLEECPGIILS